MTEEKKKKGEKGVEFDFGIGKLSLGGLFEGIEKLIDLASELKEKGGEIKKEGRIDLGHLKEGMEGVYGFSIKTVVGGRPVVETFGNIKKTPEGPTVTEEREPLTDVFNEENEVRVIAEIPGVSEDGITVHLKGDILDIFAVGKNRRYYKEILLPAKVKAEETLNRVYRNGILEIRLKK